jgi:hypothetical protein
MTTGVSGSLGVSAFRLVLAARWGSSGVDV